MYKAAVLAMSLIILTVNCSLPTDLSRRRGQEHEWCAGGSLQSGFALLQRAVEDGQVLVPS